ncbi:(2,3-dihydroxybenzoyl)adenylate synthase [Streptomyces sp. NPDC020681]|uniref:(2,3-dihydroxybenzoyl)adenylate synthase n=1 Tax=Streptomyces sp. NPDC020681 TaxID=3365083 RepID=UPI0037A1BCE0
MGELKLIRPRSEPTISQAIEQVALHHGNRVAVAAEATEVTYSELIRLSTAFASGLVRAGLRAGDRVVLQLPNRWEFVPVLLGCMKAGVVPALVLPTHRRHELTRISGHIGAGALIVDGEATGFDHVELAHQVQHEAPTIQHVFVVGGDADDDHDVHTLLAGDLTDLPEAADPGQTAMFLMSSGTTGSPKVVPRTHRDYLYDVRHSAELAGLDSDAAYLAALPLAHTFPLGCPGLLGALITGGRCVVVPSPRPDLVFEAVRRHRVTVTAAVPTVVRRWLQEYNPEQWDLSSLRVLQVGGARLSAALAALVGPVFGCEVQQVYGMSEGMLNFTRLADDPEIVQATQGRPFTPRDQIRIVDGNGQDVPTGETGELLVRGPGIFGGYYRAPADNAAAFLDGWFRTGDLVRLHPSGNLVVEGRIKDVINRGGEKISALEIEDLLHELPEVDKVAVVAVADTEMGERVCACVVPIVGAVVTVEGLSAALTRLGVARYKHPEVLRLISEIPLTGTGKIDKVALRNTADRDAGPHQIRPSTGLVER